MKRDRKSEILAAAERLLDAGGPHAVSMRGVAAALGISVGNLTYHFPQKKDLLEAVMRARLPSPALTASSAPSSRAAARSRQPAKHPIRRAI